MCTTRGRSRLTGSQRNPPPTEGGRPMLSRCRGSTASASLTPNSSRSGCIFRWVGWPLQVGGAGVLVSGAGGADGWSG